MFLKLNERAVFAPEDGTGTPAADAGAPAADAGKPAEADAGSLLYGKEAEASEGDKAKDTPADDAAAVEAAKAARKAELDAMTPEDRAKAEAEDTKKAEDAATAAKLKEVPEDGKYEFTLPDGMEMDTVLAEKAGPVLKDAGITREQANKLAGIIAADRKERFEQWGKTQEEWVKAAKTDKEYGGDKFDASITGAKRVLNKFGTPELQEYLTASGGGNHPEMIRFMARVGNAISDDSPPGSETPAGSKPKDHAEILYGPQSA
jgi:hypothetical protein